MPLTFVQTRSVSFFKTVTVPATKQLKVTIDGVEDTDFRVTAPSDDSADVTVTIQAVVKS